MYYCDYVRPYVRFAHIKRGSGIWSVKLSEVLHLFD